MLRKPFGSGQNGRWWGAVAAGLLLLAGTVGDAKPKAPKAPARAKVQVDAKTGLEALWLPGGKFHLGCEPQDKECFADELPGRAAEVRGFWMGKTPVTIDAWAKCVAAGACSAPKTGGSCNWEVPGRGRHPVNCVDAAQSAAFCGWIGMRLPTVEEWEYAAKGGEHRIFPWGDEPVTAARANYCELSCFEGHLDWTWTDKSQRDGWVSTAPVGSFPAGASRHGLLDMSGNASQWTSTDAGEGTKEVRGGAWDLYPRYLRTTTRIHLPPGRWYDNVTVRCAK